MDFSKDIAEKLQVYLDDPSKAMDSSKNENLLANRTYNEVAEYLKTDKRVILPIGSTEQHGPDGILGVDHITATGIAYTLAAVTGIYSAPALNYGMAIHHLGFPGSVALRPTTYINVIVDILSSLKKHGLRKLSLLTVMVVIKVLF